MVIDTPAVPPRHPTILFARSHLLVILALFSPVAQYGQKRLDIDCHNVVRKARFSSLGTGPLFSIYLSPRDDFCRQSRC